MRLRILCSCAIALAAAAASFAQLPSPPTGAARELPSTVLNAIQKAYPAATVTSASQERQDGKIAFRVECQDRQQRRVLVYDLSGFLLEASEPVNEKDLPAPVAAAVRSQSKAQFVKGMKVTRGALVHYELTLRGSRKTTMIVKPDGAIVSFR